MSIARDFRAWITIAAALAVVAVGTGCNDDDGGGGGVVTPGPAVLDVEPGTWAITPVITGGGEGCPIAVPDKLGEFRTALCDGLDLNQWASTLGFECTFQISGDQMTGNCGGEYQGVPYTGTATGSVGAGGHSFTFAVQMTTAGAAEGSTCRYSAVLSGVWETPDPCTSGED